MTAADLNSRFRMPTVFGPSCGPRRGPDGQTFDFARAPRTTATVSFLTTTEALAALLPPAFELAGEPVVTVEWTALHTLEWLAGRGYNMLGIKYNATFRGATDQATGPFLAVLWENLPDPIISGREELGFAKLYCELPEPRRFQGRISIDAAWDNHTFLRMNLDGLADAPAPESPAPAAGESRGILHYRYLPRVSAPGISDVAEAVLTPAGGYDIHYQSFQRGTGAVAFARSSWEQLPTMFHIVNCLDALPVLESRGATLAQMTGAKDLGDQRVLR